MESSISTHMRQIIIKLPIEMYKRRLRLNECGILFGDKQSKEVDNITHIINVFPPYFC